MQKKWISLNLLQHKSQHTVLIAEQEPQTFLTLPYLPFGVDACTRQTPSAEATARAQCASPTDLNVNRTSLKLWQTSAGDDSAYPMEE